MALGINSHPSDEHSHDGSFTCAGGELQSYAQKLGISFLVRLLKMPKDALRSRAEFWCDFCEPDRCFDSFNLTKEWALI